MPHPVPATEGLTGSFAIAFHHLDHCRQLWLPYADTGRDRQALLIPISTDVGVQTLIRKPIGDFLNVPRGHQLQHQIPAKHVPPADRKPVAINHIDGLGQLNILKLLSETIVVFPVYRALLTIQ